MSLIPARRRGSPSAPGGGAAAEDAPSLEEKLLRLRLSRPADSEAPAPRRRALPWGLALGCLVIAGGGFAAGQQMGGGEKAAATGGPAAAAASPKSQSLSGLTASGHVVARRQATIAAQVTGQVESILVEEGARVEAGQVLATLDSDAVQAGALGAAALVRGGGAEARRIDAQLAEARAVHRRYAALDDRGFARAADVTASAAAVKALEAQVDEARARISAQRASQSAARTMVDRYTIRAPFAGIVTAINAQPGEMISPASAGGFTRTGICTIVDMSSLEVEVDVGEAYISRVRAGQPVAISLDAYPDRTYRGKVIATVPVADRSRASFRVRIRFDNLDQQVLPEMAAKVLFEERAAS